MTTLQGARRAARIIAATTLLVAGTTGVAFAHHGWDWAVAEPTELSGVITSITIAPPHPVLEIHADGQTWTVELGNPALTERSGFVEGSAEVGQEITVLGNQASDGALRMKAVQVIVNGKTYDIYPDRIPAN